MREGLTYPSMPMENAHPNYFTDTVNVGPGERYGPRAGPGNGRSTAISRTIR